MIIRRTNLACHLLTIFNTVVYKAWEAIQNGHARTSPGKAVGFLFIPCFSLYWMFPAYWAMPEIILPI